MMGAVFQGRVKWVKYPVKTSVVALLTACAVVGTPALAQDGARTFSLPAGCTAYLTVQGTSCSVDHHFTCEGDPEGNQRRVSLSEEGVTYVGMIDRETQWLESFHPMANFSERLEDNPADPASLSELIENGIDTYDFRTLSDDIGAIRFVGQDTLTGRTVTIDGVTLEETQYNITATGEDGTLRWSSQGNEFISRENRSFYSGTDTVTTPTDTYETDDRPVEFIFPGETGFLSANPKHGCGVEMSFAPALIQPKETQNDNL